MRKLSKVVSICLATAGLFVSIGTTQSLATNALGIPDTEYNALVDLYNSTDGDSWTDNTNWLTEEVPWLGVSIVNGHVESIDLYSNGLFGSLPSSIGNLSHLRYLNLSDNYLSGSIPVEIGNLVNLEVLYLYNNQLSGSIPTQMGNLSNLEDLVLEVNQLSGAIPAQLGNLTNLIYLGLFLNQFSGSIPSELEYLSNLKYLYLDNNLLTGSIPPALGNIGSLENLDLSDNLLTGSIPAELGYLSNLRNLSLYDNDLSGSIPSSLGNLSSLRTLFLYYNRLTGTIPKELGNLTNLTNLDLYHNLLTGTIPAELGQLTNLQYLDLDSNQLTGSIPAELGNLGNLQYLNLSSNHLEGVIPAAFSGLTSLQNLELSANKLVGPAPESLADISGLSGVSIGYNALFSNNANLTAFLNQRQADWESTQTVAPTNIQAFAVTSSSVLLSWDVILFEEGAGCYEVGIGQSPGGPYIFDPANRTSDKLQASILLNSLQPGHTYYGVIRTVSMESAENRNIVTSQPSAEFTFQTVGSSFSKLLPDGAEVTAAGFITAYSDTLADGNEAYIESLDHSWGIRVTGLPVEPCHGGNAVVAHGTLQTNGNFERELLADSLTYLNLPAGSHTPFHMISNDLGGGNWFYYPQTGAGQRGSRPAGLNTIGLQVKITGKVTNSGYDSLGGYVWFNLDDGCGISDGFGNTGISVLLRSAGPPPAIGEYKVITGISSCLYAESGLFDVVLAQDSTGPPPCP